MPAFVGKREERTRQSFTSTFHVWTIKAAVLKSPPHRSVRCNRADPKTGHLGRLGPYRLRALKFDVED